VKYITHLHEVYLMSDGVMCVLVDRAAGAAGARESARC